MLGGGICLFQSAECGSEYLDLRNLWSRGLFVLSLIGEDEGGRMPVRAVCGVRKCEEKGSTWHSLRVGCWDGCGRG